MVVGLADVVEGKVAVIRVEDCVVVTYSKAHAILYEGERQEK